MKHARLPLRETGLFYTKGSRGFTIVEAVLSATIFAMAATACFGVFFYGQQLARSAGKKMQATFLASEGAEAVRAIRDMSNSLPDDGTYGLDASGSVWQLTDTPDNPLADFTRTITVEAIDDTTKKITVAITWPNQSGDTGAFSIITYLSVWTASIAHAAP